MKTLRKSEAPDPEFKVATVQDYLSPENSLKYMVQKYVGLNNWVCQKPAWLQFQVVAELFFKKYSIPRKGLFYFYSCIIVVTLHISVLEFT